MSKHFRVPARVPVGLREAGVSAAVVLRRAGLPPDFFDQPRVQVTTEQLFAIWRAIAEMSGDPAIGLRLGTIHVREHFDLIGLAALSTGSFGEAMRQVARHKQLSCPEEIVLEHTPGEWSVQFRWLQAEGDEPSALTDMCFAWVVSIAQHGTGRRLVPLRVEVSRPQTAGRTLERHFGCTVLYGRERDALVFRETDTALPFVTQNAELLAMLAPQLDEALKQHKGQESFPDRVRSKIQQKLAGRRPKIQEVARELHISSRTLQRRLQDSGSSFQQVLEEARHQLARHYLSNPVLELNEAAYLLGYEDAGSFVRAFRSWEGLPPAQWRGRQRMRAASEAPRVCAVG